MARISPEIEDQVAIRWTRRDTDGTVTNGVYKASDYSQWPRRRDYVGGVTPGYMSLSRREKQKLPFLEHDVSISKFVTDQPYSELIELGNVASYPNVQLFSTYERGSAHGTASYPSAAHLAEAYTKARARLADKVNAMSVNLAQAMGERKQTAGLLLDTANRIVAAARALKRARLGDFVNALELNSYAISAKQWNKVVKTPYSKRIANHWLEFQYGWQPLLQDAFGAAELLSSHIDQDRYNQGSTASGKAIEVLSRVGGDDFSSTYTKVTETKTKLCLAYRLDSAARSVLAQTGISNPALLAWELLPYSFVVDWFLPVGNYLQALQAFCGFEFVGGYEVNKTTMTFTESVNRTVLDFPGGPIWRRTTIHWGATQQKILYNRALLSDFPVVGNLEFKNPIGGDPAGRFATALSLMRQLFK